MVGYYGNCWRARKHLKTLCASCGARSKLQAHLGIRPGDKPGGAHVVANLTLKWIEEFETLAAGIRAVKP